MNECRDIDNTFSSSSTYEHIENISRISCLK